MVIIAFFACTRIALLWRIRRRRIRRRQFSGDADMRRGGRTISPFALLVEDRSFDNVTVNTTGADAGSDALRGSISASAIARQQLETQLRAATEKMVELEELAEGDPNAVLDGSGGEGGAEERPGQEREQGEGQGQGAGGIREGQGPPPDWEVQMRAAKAQIDMLLARMNAMDSAWGMGVGSEPPPQYA
ncbi:hypothetical protein C8R45DRAFT_926879 [Mycena sanguinolenta]|nr:hypothetical protein C8R45DRAFT_926879 [Mycena sanguinolenta]